MRVDKKDLANRLFSVAEQRAASVGRHLGEGADHDLRAMTEHGAEELVKLGEDAERGRQISNAEADLIRLIDMAIEGATLLDGYPNDLLGERSYFPAKIRFCPCRPFC